MNNRTEAFRWLALATLVATYGLIVVGGIVRSTGSGDACPDWPRCHGELLPPLERDVLIEFTHRLIASVVGFLVLATAFASWRWQRHVPLLVWASTVAVGLVIAQIILGGVTVLNDLPSSMVMAHLALAATLLFVLLVIAMAVLDTGVAPKEAERGLALRNSIAITAVATFALMLTGSYVSGSGASLAFRDWPLFDGSLWPEGGRLAMIHVTHRLAAGAVGLVVFVVGLRAWRAGQGQRPAARAMAFAGIVYAAQVLVGAANIWTLLQPAAVAAHLALAVGLWATLAGAAVLAHRAVGYLPGTAPATGDLPSATMAGARSPQAAPAQGPS